jgi:hypothetical protein
MNTGELITNYKDKLGFKNFSDMAKVIGVSPDFLLRLSKVQSKDELKQINIENLESVARYLQLPIESVINGYDGLADISKTVEVKYINDCDDLSVVLDELIQKAQEKNIKFDGFNMNDESKHIFIDAINILKQIVKSRI